MLRRIVVSKLPLLWNLATKEIASLLLRVEVHPFRVFILVFIVLPELLPSIRLRIRLLPRLLLSLVVGFLGLVLVLAAKLLKSVIRLRLGLLDTLRLLTVDCFAVLWLELLFKTFEGIAWFLLRRDKEVAMVQQTRLLEDCHVELLGQLEPLEQHLFIELPAWTRGLGLRQG